jgi:hypothetical protein
MHQPLVLEDKKMSKEDKIIEVLAWLLIIAIITFCIRFNYKLNINESIEPI